MLTYAYTYLIDAGCLWIPYVDFTTHAKDILEGREGNTSTMSPKDFGTSIPQEPNFLDDFDLLLFSAELARRTGGSTVQPNTEMCSRDTVWRPPVLGVSRSPRHVMSRGADRSTVDLTTDYRYIRNRCRSDVDGSCT